MTNLKLGSANTFLDKLLVLKNITLTDRELQISEKRGITILLSGLRTFGIVILNGASALGITTTMPYALNFSPLVVDGGKTIVGLPYTSNTIAVRDSADGFNSGYLCSMFCVNLFFIEFYK